MAKSCARFQPVKPGSEKHNRRLKHLDYVREELSKNNKSWSTQSVAVRLKQIKQLVKEKTGRSLQSKATPIREAVVLIKPDTTIEDLQRLRTSYKKNFGIDVFQIDIHKDEGHFNKKGKWVGNYHAHLTADFTNHQTGKSLKLTRQQMSELQTVTADVLGMERGVSSDLKHLTPIQFKVEILIKQLQELVNDVESMQTAKAFKQRLLGILNMSAKDKIIKDLQSQITTLRGDLKAADERLTTQTNNSSAERKELVNKANKTIREQNSIIKDLRERLNKANEKVSNLTKECKSYKQQLQDLNPPEQDLATGKGIRM